MYGMGTYLCLMPVFGQRPETTAMIERGLNTEHHVVPGQYVSFLYNQGGSLVKWFRNTFAAAERQVAQTSGRDLYADLLSEMPEDLSRIMVLPHFAITGPPDFIADSCGVIGGLEIGNFARRNFEGSYRGDDVLHPRDLRDPARGGHRGCRFSRRRRRQQIGRLDSDQRRHFRSPVRTS